MESEQLSNLPEGLCRKFLIDEILAATHDFSDSLVIGQGGFAKVYKGDIDNASRTVAIKKLMLVSPKLCKEFRDEILMVSKFRHSHLVSMLGYCEKDDEMILVYEYVAGGTLNENLHKLGRDGSRNSVPLRWIERLKIGISVARGLDYLHTGTGITKEVIHRDIKSSNILLDENRSTAKIADFGLSKICPTNQLDTSVSSRPKGTFGYIDPVYASSGSATSKSDVYSFGVVLFELLSGRPAVDSKLYGNQRSLAWWAQVYVRKGRAKEIIDPSLKSEIQPRSLSKYVKIAERCLNECPEERPTMTEVLAELLLALTLQETGKQNGSTFSEKFLEFFKVKPRPISDNNALDHAMEAAPTAQKDKLLVADESKLIAPTSQNEKLLVAVESKLIASTAQKNKLLVAVGREFLAPVLMDLDELKEITNIFSEKALIGEGSNASVYYGIFEVRQNIREPKFIPSRADDTGFTVVRVKHENVVELLGYCVSRGRLFLVYEHASNGSLYNLLHGFCGAQPDAILSWSQRVKIAVCAAKGLQYLHQMAQIHHAGIKSSNIFIFDNDVAKIVDIEFISDFDNKFLSQIACMDPYGVSHHRPPYPDDFDIPSPPERIWRETSKSNVFSFGGVLFELLTGRLFFDPKLPYGGEHEMLELLKKMREDKVEEYVDRRLGKYPRKAAVQMAAVAVLCVHRKANFRPSMDKVVTHLERLLVPQ